MGLVSYELCAKNYNLYLLSGLRNKYVSSLLMRPLYGEYDLVYLDRLSTDCFLGRFNGFFVWSLHVSVISEMD
jgi:hypothetical protein